MISIFINTYLGMDNQGKDIPIWKTGSWVLAHEQSNSNLDLVGGIGVATKEKPLKVDCSSGKCSL